MSDLDEIAAFRNRLIAFAGYVGANYWGGPGSPEGVDPAVLEHIGQERVALTQEYGRLRARITRAAGGIMQMTLPAIGIVSQDVIADAINRWDWHNWSDTVQMAQQHLDMAIGRLQADHAESPTPTEYGGSRTPCTGSRP